MTTMRLLKLLANRPPNFAGETIGIEFDDVADKLIAAGSAVEVDADGNVIATKETHATTQVAVQPGADVTTGGNAHLHEWKFDARTDPFVTDGISQHASKALHAAGLHTVDAVRDRIAKAEDALADINAIEGVSDTQAEKIVKLYGMITEHVDE